jgi:hypothetical protein
MSRCTSENAEGSTSRQAERYNALFCSDARMQSWSAVFPAENHMDDKTERTRLRASLARDKPALMIYGLLALVALVGLLLSL